MWVRARGRLGLELVVRIRLRRRRSILVSPLSFNRRDPADRAHSARNGHFAAKIGMLPKRQVSLLGTSPSTTTESVHKQIQPASTDKRDAVDVLDGEEEYTK